VAVAVSTDWRKAPLAPADVAMLEFGERLTVCPAAMTEDDVDSLRRHGFDDGAIVSVTLAAAYRNYITRVADALGVELRRDATYAAEILEAFGVQARDLRTTIYGDRLATSPEPTSPRPLAPRTPPRSTGVEDRACWVDTTPADPDRFARAQHELFRLTEPHPLRNLGLSLARRPEALAAAVEFARLLGMGGSHLGRRVEAIIGVVVAALHGVPYLGVHHAQALLDEGASPGEITALARGSDPNVFDGRERAIIRFCARATQAPSTMARADVEFLRAAGFDDRGILTIGASAAFESFLCGVAAGLGVGLEHDRFAPEAMAAFVSGAEAGARD
jgi:alkylhydroperoxidase family enzyme